MKISAKTKDYRLLVKVKTSLGETVDEKELDRFARVYMRCFLKPTQIKRGLLEYSGPVGISLKERLNKEVTKRDFLFILEYIVVAVQKLRGNNFPIHNLNMDMQYIYINETTKELQFLYVPLNSEHNTGNVIALINSVIYSAKPAAEKDMEYVSRFNYFFRSLKPFDVDKVEQFIYQEDRSIVNTIKKHNAGQSGFMTNDHKHYQEHLEDQAKKQAIKEATVAFREKAPAQWTPDADATGLLSDYMQTAPAQPDRRVVTPPAAECDEATGLLSDYMQTAPAQPDRRVVTPPAAEYDEATGLLSDYMQTAPAQPDRRVVTPPAAEYDEATGLLSDYMQTAPAQPDRRVVTPPVAEYDEATGLLDDGYGFAGCGDNAPSTGAAQKNRIGDCFDPDATGLLTDEDTEGTVLLQNNSFASTAAYPELFRVLNGETICVNKPVFRLGKERSYVDYFVTNNNAVSRSHADIITRQTGYFVIDLNSKNRTYVNNQVIPPQVETPIRDGDLLRLGNEDFIFRAKKSRAETAQICPGCNSPTEPGANFCFYCGRRLQK